ncbi:hypothetical protein [Fictibacillus sp. S7]|uniref:hypothetical protein n=1 Tax=Fictibacillus sp. S7 TaxID=2212476 RepID=UPI001013324C|nr:hypothetical protein [Fictibacillus sp. S7]RXZ00612.1 hypothetical protein DMO16_13535 [Fictibacillus sp. S7]
MTQVVQDIYLTFDEGHAQKTLYELTGVTSHLTRAPFGSHPYMKEDLRHGLVQYMMRMWGWDVDTAD